MGRTQDELTAATEDPTSVGHTRVSGVSHPAALPVPDVSFPKGGRGSRQPGQSLLPGERAAAAARTEDPTGSERPGLGHAHGALTSLAGGSWGNVTANSETPGTHVSLKTPGIPHKRSQQHYSQSPKGKHNPHVHQPTDERMTKCGMSVHIVEYGTAWKRNEAVTRAATQMSLEDAV